MSRIPPRFEHATLANFRCHTESQSEAHLAVREWLADTESGPLLALIGKQGTGKSHLLYAVAKDLVAGIDGLDPVERSRSGVRYPFVAPWYTLSDQLRFGRTVDTEGGSRSLSAAEVRAELWGRRVVLIDEVRRTSGSEFDDTELAKLACHAYDNRVAVLITTNWNPLSDVMGPAAASRFAQVVIDGPDRRQKEVA